MDSKTKTAFIGLSHLGLVTSICWATFEKVVTLDLNKKIVKNLKNQQVPIYEPNLQQLYDKSKKNYYPTDDFSILKKIKLVFFTLDTPLDGSSPKELNRLVDSAVPFLGQDATIVIMSQIPTGYCRAVYNKIQKKRPELNFSLYYWVNTIIIGNSIKHFLKPERIIIGGMNSNEAFNLTLAKALKNFICPVIKMSFESAELTKSAVNLFLAASISAANNLADFCELTGADINEIIPALKLDKRIGPSAYLKPTLRIAGGHLERELFHFVRLGQRNGLNENLAKYILELNKNRYLWVIKKINKFLKSGSTICIWGLAYKKNSASTENAASLEIIKALKNKASLKVYDPMAILPKNINGYKRYDDKYKTLEGADCLLILTEWEEFQEINLAKIKKLMNNYLIIDSLGILNDKRDKLKDFRYISMGTSNLRN